MKDKIKVKSHPNIFNKLKLLCKQFCSIGWKSDPKIKNYFSQLKPISLKYNIYEISCKEYKLYRRTLTTLKLTSKST